MTRIIIVLGVILVAGIVAWSFRDSFIKQDQGLPGEPVSEQESQQEEGNVVAYTDSGYSPKTITVQQGEEIVWKNESSRVMWTASAIHPTHEVYPGSSIGKCNKGEADEIFDACQGIVPGESWSFRFDEAGQWGYHNHLGASDTGRVIVE